MGIGGTAARSAITYRDRRAFWFGTGAIVPGVALHLPMFLGARDMEYRLVGMPVDPGMLAGMGLIVGGLALTAYGLVPAGSVRPRAGAAANLRVQTLDQALAVLAVARFGIETRRRGLEEITAIELKAMEAR